MEQSEKKKSELLMNIQKKTKDYIMIGICSPDGLILYSNPSSNKKVYANDRLWFKRMQASQDFALGEYQVGRITGKPGITLGYPITGQLKGKPLASVYATLDLDVIQKMIDKIDIPESNLINLIDRNGTIIVRNPDISNLRGKPSMGFKEFRKAGKKTGEYIEALCTDGNTRLFTFHYVPGSDDGLYVGVGLSLNKIYADSRKKMFTGFLWLGLSTVLAFVIVWFISSATIIRDIKKLVIATKKLAAGDYNARIEMNGGGAVELKELSASFNNMAGELEKYRDKLENIISERTVAL
jgi:HAMP domain-containing protein